MKQGRKTQSFLRALVACLVAVTVMTVCAGPAFAMNFSGDIHVWSLGAYFYRDDLANYRDNLYIAKDCKIKKTGNERVVINIQDAQGNVVESIESPGASGVSYDVVFWTTDARFKVINADYGGNNVVLRETGLPDDFIYPTARDLDYTGSEQALLTGGNVPAGWRIIYTVDDGSFSMNEIPKRTEPGTYTVSWCAADHSYVSHVYKKTIKIKGINPLTFADTTLRVPFSSSNAVRATMQSVQNAQGSVTYEILNQPEGNHFSIEGNKLVVPAGTPAGEYSVRMCATAAGNSDYSRGVAYATITVKVIDDVYPIWVGGSAITVASPSGEGWHYDAESNTLTLNGYSYNQAGYSDAAIYADGDLNIELNGTNTVACTTYGIYVQGNLTIDGTGSLDAASSSGFGIYTKDGDITINGGTVTATGANSKPAIRSDGGSVLITDGKVTATARGDQVSALSAGQKVKISGGDVNAQNPEKANYQYGYGIDGGTGVEITGGKVYVVGEEYCIKGSPVTIGKGMVGKAWIRFYGTQIDVTDDFVTARNNHTLEKALIEPHAHSFTYEVGTGNEANTITATCSAAHCTLDDGTEEHNPKVALTINAANANYDEAAHGASLDIMAWTAAGLNAPTTIQYADRNNTEAGLSDTAPTNAGDYTASVTVEDKTATADFTISRADIELSVTLEGWTYGEEANAPSVTGNPDNGAVTYTYKEQNAEDSTYVADVPTNAGQYTVKATFAETDNYNAGEATADFAIAKADIEPSVTLEGWTYGEEANAPSVDAETNPGNGDVTYTYKVKDADDSTYTSTVPTAAGNYTVKAAIAETANYNSGVATKDFTISKAALTVTAKDQNVSVGDEVPDLSSPVLDTHYTVTGLVGEDALTTAPVLAYQKNGSAATPDSATASTYDIVASGASASDNYTISYTKGTLTIAKGKAVAATVTANNRTYDGTEKPLVTVDDSTLVGGEMQYALGTATEVTGEYGAAIPTATDIGTYYVWYRVVGDDNHESTDELGPVEVALAPSPEFGEPDFILPEQLKVLDESAFEGVTSLTIVDAHNCTSIGKDAFKGTGLEQIRLPKDCEIDPEAFGEQRICVFAPAGGTTEAFCADYDNLVFIAEAE